MLPQFSLYQPTATEIAAVAASAQRRHPALASRIGKASDLLLDGSLQLEPVAWEVRNVVHWRIASQSGRGTYVVTGNVCPCQDRRTQYCKHSIAVALYTKILANHANADIRARQIDLGILPNGEFHAYGKRMGYVQMKRTGTAYTFTNAASAVHYSLWAVQREAVQASVNWTAPTLVWAGHSVTLAAA